MTNPNNNNTINVRQFNNDHIQKRLDELLKERNGIASQLSKINEEITYLETLKIMHFGTNQVSTFPGTLIPRAFVDVPREKE